jgi:O-methyltransferase
MNIPVFMIANILAGAILLFLLGRFAWNMWFSTAFYPAEWLAAKKEGRIDPELAAMARSYPDKTRFFAWWLQVERLNRDAVRGDFAEVGVYKGESARIIHRMDPNRPFHLFDTFKGFPKVDLSAETGEAAGYTTHHFADTGVARVLKRINGNPNIIVHKGYFPETAQEVKHGLFALVNLDADLNRPTKAALEFFYPRLAAGGVIFIHDYNYRWEGIRKAVDGFIASTGEVAVLLPDPDSTLIIVKRKK